MAQQAPEPQKQGILRRIFGRHNANDVSVPEPVSNVSKAATEPEPSQEPDEPAASSPRPGSSRRASYNVVPGLPRAQTFKRQQSEKRTYLEPVQPTPDERRALSMDRRSVDRHYSPMSRIMDTPRVSAPGLLGAAPSSVDNTPRQSDRLDSRSRRADLSEKRPETLAHLDDHNSILHEGSHNVPSMTETHSVADSGYEDDDIIARELDTKWILNLSMHFRDRSKREKFFVTYRQEPHTWRRVTISLDYRNAPPDSLEAQLDRTRYQRDKIARIYEAIRESLDDIQFYDTVTNLKLQTSDGRLFVHVMEDGNEIIQYPPVREVRHLNCMQVKERDIVFESHMSGFVYKVKVGDKMLIKKEIPSPETVDEFLYEINALNALGFSENVIDFYGVVVDDRSDLVKGLLIDYADRGTLIDILYEAREKNISLPWETREKWARQIVQGLADVHESGFVQGDFTLSNIVITKDNDARIIDINRRGCPVGWEPPEAAALIASGHRIGMYIGVKSDLYQLGMVLWAIAVLEDEPEMRGRPLFLEPEDNVPDWYRQVTEICLSDNPRSRSQAVVLLHTFPPLQVRSESTPKPTTLQIPSMLRQTHGARSPSEERRSGLVPQSSSEWSHVSRPHLSSGARDHGSSYHPPRGRSLTSRPPRGDSKDSESPHRRSYRTAAWCDEVDFITQSHDSDGAMILDPDQVSQHSMSVPTPGMEAPMFMDHSAQTLKADIPVDIASEVHEAATYHYGSSATAEPHSADESVIPRLLVDAPSPVEHLTDEKTTTDKHRAGFNSAEEGHSLGEVLESANEENLTSQDHSSNLQLQRAVASLDHPSVQQGKPIHEEAQSAPSSQQPAPATAQAKVPDDAAPNVSNTKKATAPTEKTVQDSVLTRAGTEIGIDHRLAAHISLSASRGPEKGSEQTHPATWVAPHTVDQAAAPADSTFMVATDGYYMGTVHNSSSAPVSRQPTDEAVTRLPRMKPSSDGVATPPAARPRRANNIENFKVSGDLPIMADCLSGVGGVGNGLDDLKIETGFLDDDFGITGQPTNLMISTDATTS